MSRDWYWQLLIVAYFTVGFALRLAVFGDALGLDEAEAYWFSQTLSLQYNAQPPLYFWLQWGVFQLLGESLVALALLKAVVLSVGFVLVFNISRTMLSPAGAGVATLALALVPEVSWEMQRALTHTVMAFTISAATVFVFLRLLDTQKWADYLLLGLVIGLGGLSKHNYYLVPLGLLLAAGTLPELRVRLSPRGLLLSVLIAVLIMTPYGVSVWLAPEIASGSLHKLGLDAGGVLRRRWDGTFSLLSSLVSLLGLAVLVMAAFSFGHRKRLLQNSEQPQAFLLRYAVLVTLTLAVVVLVVGLSNVRARWMMPLLWPVVPLWVVVMWPYLSTTGRKGLGMICASLWVAILIAVPFNDDYHNADFDAALAALPRDIPIGTPSIWLLGNIAYLDPERELFDASQAGLLPSGSIVIAEAGDAVALADTLGGKIRGSVAKPLVLPDTKRSDWYEWVLATP